MNEPVKVTFVEDGWRFVWRPLDMPGVVKIAEADDPEGNWMYQMDAPLTRTTLTFETILRDFRQDCRTWLIDHKEDR